jgi:hypothetical protein
MSPNCAHKRVIVHKPNDISYVSAESNGRMKMTVENRRTQRKTCLSATLSTTNPT